MLENVKRVREPLGWALLAIVAATIALGVAQIVQFMMGDFAASPDANWSMSVAFWALSLLPYPLVLALVAVVFSGFVAPVTRHALLLGRITVWVLTIGGVLAVAGVIYGLRAMVDFGQGTPPLDLIASGLGLLAGVAAIVSLWVVIWRGEDAGDEEHPAIDAPGSWEPEDADEPEEPEEEKSPTVWKRPDAAGTVWRTAAEAATGAPGSRYLAPEEDEGEDPSGESPRS